MVIGTPSWMICTPRMPKRGMGARIAKRTPPDRLKLRRFSTKNPGMPAKASAGDARRWKA